MRSDERSQWYNVRCDGHGNLRSDGRRCNVRSDERQYNVRSLYDERSTDDVRSLRLVRCEESQSPMGGGDLAMRESSALNISSL